MYSANVAVENGWRLVTTICVLTRRFMSRRDVSSTANCSVSRYMT